MGVIDSALLSLLQTGVWGRRFPFDDGDPCLWPRRRTSRDSAGVSCAWASWRVGRCDSAIDGMLPGRADSCVFGFFSSIDGVGGLLVGASDVSSGVRAGRVPVAQSCWYEPVSAGGWSVVDGDSAGGLFPAAPLSPLPATASHHVGESVGGHSEVPDLSCEGLFDIHQDHLRSAASLRLLQDTQGCPFRMRRPVDQILRRQMVSSSTIRTCWSTSTLRSRHGYGVVALCSGFITWAGRRPCQPPCSCSMMLDWYCRTSRFCSNWWRH